MSESHSESAQGTSGAPNASRTAIREARLTVDDADLATVGIGDLVSLWRDCGLRDFDLLACQRTGAVVQVFVEEPLPEEALASLDCLDRWAHVSEPPGGQLYVVEIAAATFPPSVTFRRDDLLDSCDPELHDDGLTFSLVGSMNSVAAAIEDLEGAGLEPALLRIGPYTGHDGPLDALTERQREVVTTAYDLGYYEVPRSVSADEVAAELALEPSTVSEHLQRAERNFLTRQLPGAR